MHGTRKRVQRLVVGVFLLCTPTFSLAENTTTTTTTDTVTTTLPVYETGQCSWYGKRFHRRRTASGEIFDKNKVTAAHPKLPFGTVIKVIDVKTGNAIKVRINDRGPFKRGRVVDLSEAAARKLGVHKRGVAKVVIKIVEQK